MQLTFDSTNKYLLTQYINNLIKDDKLYKFYKCDEWIKLRQHILYTNHYECYRCKERGKISKATLVHHVNHVRVKPQYALSKMYVDSDGEYKINLLPLCDACHEIEHKRFYEGHENKTFKKKFNNNEQW